MSADLVDELAPADTRIVWDPFLGRSRFSYTGKLRAQYLRPEVPTREVPEHIERPEYVRNVKGESFGEKVAYRIGSIKEHAPSDIEAMRKVCKVSAIWSVATTSADSSAACEGSAGHCSCSFETRSHDTRD